MVIIPPGPQHWIFLRWLQELLEKNQLSVVDDRRALENFVDWVGRFEETRGARAVVVVDIERVSDSCGYGVPLMEPAGERHLLPEHMERKGADGVVDYRRAKNRASIDGLPAFTDDGA